MSELKAGKTKTPVTSHIFLKTSNETQRLDWSCINNLFQICPTEIPYYVKNYATIVMTATHWTNFALSNLKLILSWCTGTFRILTVMVTIVWRLYRSVSVISQVRLVPMQQGSRNQKTRNKFCIKMSVDTWKSPSTQIQTWFDLVPLRTTCIKNVKFKIVKARIGCPFALILQRKPKLGRKFGCMAVRGLDIAGL